MFMRPPILKYQNGWLSMWTWWEHVDVFRLSLKITGRSSRQQKNSRSFSYPNLRNENRKTSTCNRLDLQTLTIQPVMSTSLPDQWAASPAQLRAAKYRHPCHHIFLVELLGCDTVTPRVWWHGRQYLEAQSRARLAAHWSGRACGHNRLNSECLQVQPVTRWRLPVEFENKRSKFKAAKKLSIIFLPQFKKRKPEDVNV